MIAYQTHKSTSPGSEFKELHKKVFDFYQKEIVGKTKRKPYLRAAYFNREKIFFDHFWTHLFQKSNWKDRVRRLKYFIAATDLIKNSRNQPSKKLNPNKKSETLYRFAGLTKDKQIFYVQIKENKNTKTKQLMSIFPPE